MRGTIGDVVVKIFGALVIVAGLAGLALPIIPGWVLIFAGLSLMGEHRLYLWAKRLYQNRVARRAVMIPKSAAPEELLND